MTEWRSRSVGRAMVLAAAMMLSVISCSSENPKPIRNRYESIKNCEEDYGKGKCETGPQRTGGGMSGFYYFGPWYSSHLLGSSSGSNFVGSSAGASGYSSRASGVVNGAGEHMPMSQARSATAGAAGAGALSAFSSRGASSVPPARVGGYTMKSSSSGSASRGGFGSTGRGFSSAS